MLFRSCIFTHLVVYFSAPSVDFEVTILGFIEVQLRTNDYSEDIVVYVTSCVRVLIVS